MRILPLLALGSAALLACTHGAPERRVAFVSKSATEATLRFSHTVEIDSDSKPSAKAAKEQVEAQVLHLFGPMERGETTAAPKEDHSIDVTGIRKLEDGRYAIDYDYEGTIVVEKGPRNKLKFPLPNNPDEIYEQATVGNKVPCTDEHYDSEDDFWYFWAPAPMYPKCKLKEGEHFQWVTGEIERIKPENKTTYPEYHRLADKDGVIDMVFLIGMDDPDSSGKDPHKSKDVNGGNYRRLYNDFKEMGYTFRKLSDAEIKKVVKDTSHGLPWVEVAERDYGNGTKIRAHFFFGASSIDEKSTPFHYYLKEGLRHAAVVLYDGHSGLGANLDLADIASTHGFKFQLRKGYQILFFNSCTSYTYYNALYFQKKRKKGSRSADAKGTKDLDILANGLSTDFETEQNMNLALPKAIHLWAEKGKWTSYQKLAKEIDTENLFTVNGDEDNPTKPVND